MIQTKCDRARGGLPAWWTEKGLGSPYQFFMDNWMKTYSVMHLLGSLFLVVYFVSASHAQTCNPNIPLKTPDNEFIDHGDGTVTHQRTGLMWKRCPEGLYGSDCDQGVAMRMNWGQALGHAVSYEYAGHTIWRLPNMKELSSIVETACYAPAINLSIFPNDLGSYVWSSSPDANSSNYAWILGFYYGYDSTRAKSYDYYVRLVRGGQ